MAVEVIAKIKQINNGKFKLIDACDVEMANGQDLETYLKNFSGSGGVCECDPEIYIGPTPPTDPNIKIWVDTSKQHVDSSFSSLVIQEFRNLISSLTKKVTTLEKEVAYLKAVIGGGDIPPGPNEPETNDILLVNENGALLTNEIGQILCGSKFEEPVANDILLVNEDGFLLVNEFGQVLCGNKREETVTSAQIMVNEYGNILTNEKGQVLCFNVGVVSNTQIMVNENDQILTNENGDILCFQVSDSTNTINVLVNENDKILTNENGDVLCLDVYDMLLVNEDDKVLVNENNKILKL